MVVGSNCSSRQWGVIEVHILQLEGAATICSNVQKMYNSREESYIQKNENVQERSEREAE